jgi:hypothetical protein
VGLAAGAASPWLAGALGARAPHASGAIVFAIGALLVAHLAGAAAAIAPGGGSVPLELAYELLKIAVLAGAGVYALTHAAAGRRRRGPSPRTAAAPWIVSAVVFAVAYAAAGPLVALGWVLAAGGLRPGGPQSGRPPERPAAAAVLLALAFLPPLLDPGGRDLPPLAPLAGAVAAALAAKAALAFGTLRLAGRPAREALACALVALPPSEIALALLGFAVTRWLVEPPLYFGVLGFTLLAAGVAALASPGSRRRPPPDGDGGPGVTRPEGAEPPPPRRAGAGPGPEGPNGSPRSRRRPGRTRAGDTE